MPILTKSGRIVIAESIAERPLHLAWGLGDGAWTSPPSEDPDAVELQDEIGRRVADQVSYVVPDPVGLIVLPTGRFSLSVSPTNHLLVTFRFDFLEAQGSVVREIGVFAGTVVNTGLPPGQEYFTPAQIQAPGRLLHLENLSPIFRSPAVRESFEIVISF